MKRYLSSVAAVAVLAAAMIGCASSPRTAGAPAPHKASQTASLPGKPGCFFIRNFQGSWTYLSESELIIYAPLYTDAYYVKLFEPVINLGFDQSLGFEDIERTGQICNSTQDDLLVPHWTPHHVPIVAVRQLTPAQARDLLQAHGLKVPAQIVKAAGAANS